MTDRKKPDQAQAVPTQPKLLDGILGGPPTGRRTDASFSELASEGQALIQRLRDAIKNAKGKRKKQTEINKGVAKLLKKHTSLTVRMASKLLECSIGAVAKAPAWKAMGGRRSPGKVVSVEDEDHGTVVDARAENPADLAELNELIAAQRQEELEDEGIRRRRPRL